MKIHTIRFKITAITLAVILATVLGVIAVCYAPVRTVTDHESVEMMRLIGQDTQNILNQYFSSIEQAVEMTASEAIESLDSVVLAECGGAGTYAAGSTKTKEQENRLDAYLAVYCSQIQDTFQSVASHTYGSITYYYCINPEVSENVHGFFYSRVGKAGFVGREPLDARTLDPKDKEHTTWYYTPIERGRPSWVGPYTAHFLDEIWICSYLVPIYNMGTLIGVLGMDIPVDTMVEQVRPIKVYETGFASLCDASGHIFYHPNLSQGIVPELSDPSVSDMILQNESSGDTMIRYTAEGEKRQMSFSTLQNGMKLVITAPVKEINAPWISLVNRILLILIAAIVLFFTVLMIALTATTRPLQRLTSAARKLAAADYDVELDYKGKDEVGELTDAFRLMRDKQKEYIDDLNRRIYTDDLTGLPNMRSFFLLALEHKASMLEAGKKPALLYINLIGMKHFNRQYGFEEGNRLLCAFAEILKDHYGRRHVCRFSLDHFAAVVEEQGLEKELHEIFDACQEINDQRSLPVRVGIYQNSIEDVDVSVACDRAKYACDLRRKTFVSGFTYFRKGMQEQLLKARYIVNHLDQALSEQWVQVFYQPLVRAVNGKVCDEEALARWIDPTWGMLSPGEFIPALEEAGLIYRLDLYVLDQILEKLLHQKEVGLAVVPHSVNLSRSDFDACDIVEEIRSRVDQAGIARDRITIEITESIIGSNFDFMKQQIERFRSLGFPVWMDDFGSGYSSLDVLESIRFDLIKFDMSFMKKLDDGKDGKIILTKLMEMATAIGVDTVCEGVETEAQKQFLQEIGCSKLQGYYYCKPIPLSEIIERNRKGIQIGYENQEESAYYEAVGRVNLYDLDVITSGEDGMFQHSFNTLPMGIVEIRGDAARFVRSNQSYRDFLRRFFDIELSGLGDAFIRYHSGFLCRVIQYCSEMSGRAFFDETMPDGYVVHTYIRRVSTNPVKGDIAAAIAILSITEPEEGTSYADIARALAADYYNIYVIDLDTEHFIEYTSQVGREDLAVERHGEQFFAAVKRDVATRIYEADRAPFLSVFTKENLIRMLDETGVFTTTYRLIDTGVPVYANMKITRMPGGNRIIMGISIIEAPQ